MELQIELKETSRLIPYVLNNKIHTTQAIDKLAASIKEFGFTTPILVDLDNVIIAGHKRYYAAQKLGLAQVPCIALNLNSDKARALRIVDNKITQDSDWDFENLKLELAQIDIDLNQFIEPFDFGVEKIEPYEEPVEKDFIQGDKKVNLGDLYQLGSHRLICGDSTSADVVAKLLGGDKPILMVTDPPYGVKYDTNWRERKEISKGSGCCAKGQVKNDDIMDWSKAWGLFPGDVVYCWHSGNFIRTVAQNLENSGFTIAYQIIWNKNNFAIGRGDYHWKHEHCFYAIRKGAKHNWQGRRDQSTVWDIASDFKLEEESERTNHSTQKPLDCMRIPILNNSAKGEGVYDPFCGSGTTLLACEKEGRKAYCVELSEEYCSTIIKRWELLSGEEAQLLGNLYCD